MAIAENGAGDLQRRARRADPVLVLIVALSAVLLGVAAGPVFSVVYEHWLAGPVGHAVEDFLSASGYSRFLSGRP